MVPRWLPNAISMFRVALVPLWLVLAFDAHVPWPALVVLLLLGASDVADGQLARRYGLATNLGATLDAVADKLAQVATVTFLAWSQPGPFTALPRWLWTVLMIRDGLMAVGWLVVWARHRKVHVQHRWHGKVSSLLLFAVTVGATAGVPAAWVTVAAVVAAALIVPGTAAYAREGWRQLHAHSP